MADYELRSGTIMLGTLHDCRALDDHNTECTFQPTEHFAPHRVWFDQACHALQTDMDGAAAVSMWLEADREITKLELQLIDLSGTADIVDPTLGIEGNQAWFRWYVG